MNQIRVLDEATANKIAAGEVVERPASIVKELMENALDAGADTISVETQDGGIRMVRVTDNGSGIAPDQMPLAFLRHATSKISAVEDLFAIETMGFRGEALASIAAVSRVTMESAVEGASGVRMVMHAGTMVERTGAAAPRGTRITVEDVFFNTPARRKFMKSPQVETRAIVDVVSKLAVGRPDISVSLKTDGKRLFKTRGSGDLKDTLAYVFAPEITRRLLPVDQESEFFRISGLVGPAFTYRAGRDMQLFYVNGRVVRSAALTRALEEAYRQRIPLRKYPVGIVMLNLSAASVDVNIHPSKLEVKFSMEELICRELTRAVRQTLDDQGLEGSGDRPDAVREQPSSFRHQPEPAKSWERVIPPAGPAGKKEFSPESQTQESLKFEGSSLRKNADSKNQEPAASADQRPAPSREDGFRERQPQPDQPAHDGQTEREIRHQLFVQMEPLGMVGSAYLLTRREGRLFLIDQHAAHERIRYEGLKRHHGERKLTTQLLMEPVELDLGLMDRQRILDHILSFETYGFLLELSGQEGFLLRGVPLGLENEDYGALFSKVLEMLEGNTEDIREQMLQRASCRGGCEGRTISVRGRNPAAAGGSVSAGVSVHLSPWTAGGGGTDRKAAGKTVSAHVNERGRKNHGQSGGHCGPDSIRKIAGGRGGGPVLWRGNCVL